MPVQSQTIDRSTRITVEVSELAWFHRLCQRFLQVFLPTAAGDVLSYHGTWDAKRERFQQMNAESAVELVAARHGVSWSSNLYGASL